MKPLLLIIILSGLFQLSFNYVINEDHIRTSQAPSQGLESLKYLKDIVPGTKWCGAGNKAESYDDLGTFSRTDNCCREHDHCKYYIEPGEAKYGLINHGAFAWSHCDCDEQFYICLKEVDTFISRTFGYFYFNIFESQCFREEYPIIRCQVSETYESNKQQKTKCVDYETDQNKEKLFQWFDNKPF